MPSGIAYVIGQLTQKILDRLEPEQGDLIAWRDPVTNALWCVVDYEFDLVVAPMLPPDHLVGIAPYHSFKKRLPSG